jgi:tetratricopeptide (TPR) repeat protein
MDLMLYEEAISLFDQALAKDRAQPGLRTKQAYAYYRMNRLEKAVEALNKELEAHPDDLKALILLSFVQFKTERPDDAEKTARLFQRVVKLNPQDFQSQLLLDQAQKKRRRPDDAAKVALSKDFLKERDVRFRYVFEIDPDEIANNVNVNAVQLIQGGLILDAARWLRMFIEIYENSPEIYYNLGQLYNTQGLNPEALRFGLRAIELKQDYRDAYDLVGNVCFKMRDFENSVRLYEQAVRLDTEDPLSYFNLGCAYNELGDLANAEKNWLEAVRRENAPAAVSEAPGAGADELKIAVKVKVEPISSPACQSLAFLYSKQGKKESALAYSKKALEFNPKTPIPYFEIGKLYLERNEAGQAQEYFKKYLSLGGDEAKVKALTKKQPIG